MMYSAITSIDSGTESTSAAGYACLHNWTADTNNTAISKTHCHIGELTCCRNFPQYWDPARLSIDIKWLDIRPEILIHAAMWTILSLTLAVSQCSG